MRTTTEQRHKKWCEMVARGMAISDVAKRYGVSRRTVGDVITPEIRVLNAIELLRRGRPHGVIRRASGLPLREIRRLVDQDLALLSTDDEALSAYAETITLETAGGRRGVPKFQWRRDPWPARLREIPADSARAYLIGMRRDRVRAPLPD